MCVGVHACTLYILQPIGNYNDTETKQEETFWLTQWFPECCLCVCETFCWGPRFLNNPGRPGPPGADHVGKASSSAAEMESMHEENGVSLANCWLSWPVPHLPLVLKCYFT